MPGSESPLGGPTLPERLLLAMKRAGLSQTDLARRLHTDSRVLRRYLSGERIPPPEITAAWERVCGLAPGELSPIDALLVPPPGTSNETTVGSPPRRWVRWAALGAGVVMVIVVWRFVDSSRNTSRPVGSPDAAPCPSRQAGTTFAGRTYKDGVVVRRGAGQDFPTLTRLAGDCDVGFRGYCIGQPIVDLSIGTLDSRWFIIGATGPLDGGLIASGVIKGNPPDGAPPMMCAGARIIPSHIELTTSSTGEPTGRLRLRASAPGADIVGLAALSPIVGAVSPAPQWQQLGFAQTAPDFSVLLNQPGQPHLVAGDVTVIAVVCLASGAPTTTEAVTTVRVLPDGSVKQSDSPTAGTDPGSEARQAACRYPSNPPSGIPATRLP